MSGGSLPRTGAGLALGTIGGVTVGLPQVGIGLLVLGVVLVAGSAILVRIGFRRRKAVGQA